MLNSVSVHPLFFPPGAVMKAFCLRSPRLLTFLSRFPSLSLGAAFLEHHASSSSSFVCSLTVQSITGFVSTVVLTSESAVMILFPRRLFLFQQNVFFCEFDALP